jgi:hypothetical protein
MICIHEVIGSIPFTSTISETRSLKTGPGKERKLCREKISQIEMVWAIDFLSIRLLNIVNRFTTTLTVHPVANVKRRDRMKAAILARTDIRALDRT